MTDTDARPARPPAKARWRRIARSPWSHLVAAIIVLALVQSFVVKLYQVPSESMEPTLTAGDRILINRLAYLGSSPGIGDVIVFNRPDSWGENEPRDALRTVVGWVGDLVGFGPSNHEALVKRVIGVPGSHVECCDDQGRVTVDDAPLDEPYVHSDLAFEAGALDCDTVPASPRCFGPVVVPDDSYLVLGDNRARSSDSVAQCRGSDEDDCARYVPASQVVGKVLTVLFPFDRAFRPLAGS